MLIVICNLFIPREETKSTEKEWRKCTGQKMDKGDRGNMFDPCWRKNILVLDLMQALTIKTLAGLEQWAEM